MNSFKLQISLNSNKLPNLKAVALLGNVWISCRWHLSKKVNDAVYYLEKEEMFLNLFCVFPVVFIAINTNQAN